MWIQSLFLKNFRNWKESRIEFSPKGNRILGDNGQGKTNLLEALYFLSTGRSFRTKTLTDLIFHDAEYFHVEAAFFKDNISQTLSVTYEKNARKILYNQTSYSSFSGLLGIIPSVLFAPSDINLINGAPIDRRRFINMHLAQVDPLYVYHLGRFHRALKQRNELLKLRRNDTLTVWEHELTSSAMYLMQKRKNFVKKIMQSTPEYLETISGGNDQFSLRYCPSIPLKFQTEKESILQLYRANRAKDFQFATTQIGPHRDDLHIFMRGQKAKGFSSEGQKRSILAALKCAEWKRLQTEAQYPPLLSIDDFGVHLDQKRLNYFQNIISQDTQVFLTMPREIENSSFEGKTHIVCEGKMESG